MLLPMGLIWVRGIHEKLPATNLLFAPVVLLVTERVLPSTLDPEQLPNYILQGLMAV